MSGLRHDMAYAVRSLLTVPGFTALVVLTLAIGIGALATMYGSMRTLLLQPPPHVAEPNQVRRLYFHHEEAGGPRVTSSSWLACVADRLRAESVTIQHAAAFTRFEVSIGSGAGAARARVAVVSAGFWAATGTRAEIGRVFADEETRPIDGPRVAILGHAFWQQRYGGAIEAMRGTLRIRGEPYEIVGVTPRGFRGIEPYDVDIWLPLASYTLSGRRWETDTSLSHVVRLRPGVTATEADAELSRVVSDIVDEDAGCERGAAGASAARLSVTAAPLSAGIGSNMEQTIESRVSVWLVGVAAALLGVACTNVASLLLLRALRRQREIAVRLALGMSLRRLAVQLFAETAFLALLGGAAAVIVIGWGRAWLHRLLLPQVAFDPSAMADPAVLAVAAACIVGTTLLAGVVPLLQVPTDPFRALQEAGGRGTFRRGRLHGVLLVGQTALSVVLLAGAGLFGRSLHNVRGLDLGLDPDNVFVATVDFAGTNRAAHDISDFYERALARVSALPGVERASLARSIPLRSATAGHIRPEGRAEALARPNGEPPYVNYVTPGFFATAGTRVIEGRDFLPEERDAQVVIVNEAIARAGWPGRSPVGACVELERTGACATVIGVVANARRFFIREPVALLFYRPLPSKTSESGRALFVRVASGGDNTAAAALQVVRNLEPDLPFVRVQRLGDALDPQIRPWRLGASVFTAFAAVALLLAGLGLYGALSYGVAQRTREIGVRVAIGARGVDVIRLVLGDGFGLVVAGLLIGTIISLAAGPLIADLLFDVSAYDTAVFAAVCGGMLFIALLAAVVPSRQALRVDPVIALRAE